MRKMFFTFCILTFFISNTLADKPTTGILRKSDLNLSIGLYNSSSIFENRYLLYKNKNSLLLDLQAQELIQNYLKALDRAETFALTKTENQFKDDAIYIKNAKETELKDLTLLGSKLLSPYTLWQIKVDTELLEKYEESADSKYLKASIANVGGIIISNKSNGNKGKVEQEVEISVEVKDSSNRTCMGLTIKWTSDDWKDLQNRPESAFDNLSSPSSQKFPQGRSLIFWSEDVEDKNKKGIEKPATSDQNKSISIGKPQQTQCITQ